MSCLRMLLLQPFIFLILTNVLSQLTSVDRQNVCGVTGNYTSGSTYQANLNAILSSLSTNVDQYGFYNASVGENPDRVNALVLCRGDIPLDTCRSCVITATIDLVAICPNQRQATYWNPYCMLRYSDKTLFRTLAISPAYNFTSPEVVSGPGALNVDLRILAEKLRGQAAQGGPLRKVAYGNRNTSDFQTIYALLQCTPDLTSEECTSCLIGAAQQVLSYCDSRIWVRILRASCNLYYDKQAFYNESWLLELAQGPAPPPNPTPHTPPTPPNPMPHTPPTPPPGKGFNTPIIIIAISISTGLTLLICVGFILRKKKFERTENSCVEALQYDFNKLRVATNGFSEANKLGQGGFGPVYRGKLLSGREIAVKRLSRGSCQGDMEFKNEAKLLVKLQHRNLVSLLGFSLARREKLLVYEFLQNLSLDRFIFDPIRCLNLDWDKRFKIICGIAKGLLYLQEDSRLRIIHRDLKASNILLDEDMNPKIADFGTARLFVQDETRANTSKVIGTYGYMAPEYALHGQFSVKSDVYSFGVLILEIISGQKNNSFQDEENGVDLLTRAAWRNWHEGTDSKVIDPVLRGSSGIPNGILRCIHIGLLCVQQNAADRPTMASVVLMLNSFSTTLPIPSEPAFFVANDYDLEDSLVQ